MLEELIITAAVGTSRKAPDLSTDDPVLSDALAGLSDASAEGKLLGAVAILTRYELCGRTPGAGPQDVEPAADESLETCTPRAADLVGQVLATTNTHAKDSLLGEWLGYAVAARQTSPHRLLPALLDYGAGHRAARATIADVAGARGTWLMRQNPRWRFEVGQEPDPAALWGTGTREQRAAIIARLRAASPESAAVARSLLESTWKEDLADDRAAFVSGFRVSLCDDDEPFLETCLDDRSKQVRTAAAELLARLPRSAWVRRMIERASPLLKWKPTAKAGLAPKTLAGVIEISLPADNFPPDWAHRWNHRKA